MNLSTVFCCKCLESFDCVTVEENGVVCLQQAGRFFNQAKYDQQCKKRAEWCVAQKKEEEELELLQKDDMEQAREMFLHSTDKKCRNARLREAVNAQLKLHELSLDDRRDRWPLAKSRWKLCKMVKWYMAPDIEERLKASA